MLGSRLNRVAAVTVAGSRRRQRQLDAARKCHTMTFRLDVYVLLRISKSKKFDLPENIIFSMFLCQ